MIFHPPSLTFVHVMTYFCSVTGPRGPSHMYAKCFVYNSQSCSCCMKIESRTSLLNSLLSCMQFGFSHTQSIDISTSAWIFKKERNNNYVQYI